MTIFKRLVFMAALLAACTQAGWSQVRINAGSWPVDYVDSTGATWLTDRYFTGGDMYYTSNPVATPDVALYRTNRYGVYGNFSYAIPIANGSYNLTLKFAELRMSAKGQRIFNVVVNNATVLSNFDVLAATNGAMYTPVDKTFPVTVTNGRVNIDFLGVVNFPVLSAIAVIPTAAAPTPTLTISPTTGSVVSGQTQQFTASSAATFTASAGSINSSGLFTAPAVTSNTAVTVTATSIANPAVSAQASLTITAPASVSGPSTSGAPPVGYWTFDTGKIIGLGLIDSSASNLLGAIAGGLTSTTGISGQAAIFNGSNSAVTFLPDPYTDLTKSLTLAAWIRTTNASRTETIISRYNAAGSEWGYLFRTEASGKLGLVIGGNSQVSGGTKGLIDTGKKINDGQWHHVAVTLTLGQGVTFYIDGQASSTQAVNLRSSATGAVLRIGVNGWTDYGTFFNGSMDEVRVYDRVLTAADIATLANTTVAPVPPVVPSVTSITISPSTGSVASGQTQQFTASSAATFVASVGSVNSAGLFTAPSVTTNATATITATSTANPAVSAQASITVTAPVVVVPPPPAAPTGTGLVGYWTFDTSKVIGGQLLDSSGDNLTGGITGSLGSTSGVNAQAGMFNGSNAAAIFVADPYTDLTKSLTLAAWIRTTNNSRAETIVSRYNAGGSEWGYLFRTTATGNLGMVIGGNSMVNSGTKGLTDTGKKINDGQWHHVAATLTLGQGVAFFIDGQASSVQPLNLRSLATGAVLRIGVNGWTDYGTYFTGSMDEVRIYDRVLTPTEVASLANTTVIPVTPSFSLSSTSLSYTTTPGNTAAGQGVSITSSIAAGMIWNASASQSWITLGATTGTTPSNLTIGATAASLGAGNYNGTVTVSAPGSGLPAQTIAVSLAVTSTPPVQPPPTTTGNSFYVSPSGTSSGDGSISSPWSLAKAFTHPASVRPGDTIWLRGGMYGSGPTIFESFLTGTAAAPIYVRQYPGERATINGNLSTFTPYAWYWGFEITNTSGARSTGSELWECVDTYGNSTGVKIINMTLHDCMQGIGFWVGAIDAEAYGNVIYYVGQAGSTRGAGHSIYTQNNNGTKKIHENIMFDAFDIGLQAYGSGEAFVKNFDLDGNIAYNNGVLYGSRVDNILFAGGSGLDNISLQNTYTYHQPSLNLGYSRIGWQFGGTNGSLVARNNYWIGGEQAAQFWGFTNATASGNVFYSQAATMLQISGPTTQYNWDNNKYYGSGLLRLGNTLLGYGSWPGSTGIDRNSTFTAGRPTGTWAFVRPNKYDKGRGNIVIYNWNLTPTVSVDLSSVLTPGDSYAVRDVFNFYGTPVASGIYSGAPVTIPMTGLTVSLPVGGVPVRPVHTAPEFGTFVVTKQ